jgi:DNA-binding SARP family transcriptional activator
VIVLPPHDEAIEVMADGTRMVAVVGRLGVHPMVRLSLPARRILAYLAVRGQPVERGLASGQLWPDVPDETARANLRRTLWQTPREWISVVGDELMLDARTDLVEAQRVAAAALDGGSLTLPEIALLSNDILPGWHDEWVIAAQDSFRLLRVQALEAACRSMGAAGEHALATQAGAAALAAEPLRESAAEALIEAHLAQRNRYEAAQCFRSLADRLREELGVAPDPALTERLVAIGLADLISR